MTDRLQLDHLQRLQIQLPDGMLADRNWMERQDIASATCNLWVAEGWLQEPAPGVFRRPGQPLRWPHIVLSLQVLMNRAVHVGGATSLFLAGHQHYLNLGGKDEVFLYARHPLPDWLAQLDCNGVFRQRPSGFLWADWHPAGQGKMGLRLPNRMEELSLKGPACFRRHAWGPWGWPLLVSSPERAFLEMVAEIPTCHTFDIACQTVQRLVLDPAILHPLLEACTQLSVRRLAIWLLEQYPHPLMEQADWSAVELGTGTSVVLPDRAQGRHWPQYHLTVPLHPAAH